MRTFKLSPPVVFDTDCISSFLWVKRPDILSGLFKGQIQIPSHVLFELENLKRYSNYCWVPELLESKINDGAFGLIVIPAVGAVSDDYKVLTKRMGSGEAAALAYVKNQGGTVASNNLKDVKQYCETNKLELIRTDDILSLAVLKGILFESEGQAIWEAMKKTGRKLPGYDFREALRLYKAG